jgi:LppP/LprE lipoprotein
MHRGVTVARILGICGTAALLAVGVAIALMVTGDDERELGATVAAVETPAATAEAASQERRARPRLSARARASRRAAVADVEAQGYSPVSLASDRADRELRVLIGAPAGAPEGGRRAFFFLNRSYLGTDTVENSARVRVLERGGRRWATLQYRLYDATDEACCPSGDRFTVRFEFDGSGIQPLDPMPPPELRIVRQ